ncbi:integral membrane protein-like protein [Mollisia scopiformis]|uniref:Integral membrane protein-like protein n=1 Tax=Mollisia scopiformis TaxID=149040 RepID=A0A194XRC5_MOLSC|nr:integral membrane protein-like protein [Mollisia scopiformis]KUJ22743.1 integral membrane protein-like protein [Mollisia scopiformis]
MVFIASLWIMPASAVFLDFQNCLSDSTQNDQPLALQIIPLYLDAVFNTTDSDHNLNVTVWGNVTGSTVGTYARLVTPLWNDTSYWNSNDTSAGGKIENEPYPDDPSPKLTTFSSKVNVLTYEPWHFVENFCENALLNGTCPLGPSFSANLSDPYDFPSFGFSNNFYSSYAFTSFTATLLVVYGDQNATPVGCTSAIITPDMGSTLSNVVRYVPAAVLILVAFSTAFAAISSPWGSTDTFRWTTNYGRDADLLRLVTPGFGDCLQYIQFVALTGGLTLNYPGFYQPIVSKTSWSALMFNESFVSGGNGTQSLVDGVYVTHGTYGMDKLRQLVGMSEVDDVWAGMAIWLLAILASILVLIQIGFFVRWAYRLLNDVPEEDLRAKNMPFSMGNVIRIVFNYFLLPIVALSMFQLVIASKSPAFTVALAVVMLVLIIGFAVWLLYIIGSTRPKSFLFDDLPTVLLYGSLYNTYSDHAAPFALVPMFLTFIRGVAIGAVQPSGIAQLVVLAICEVITVLTLHAFRPFHSPTSMNALHTFFAVVRFSTVLLMISFAPSLGVTEGPKGWIGYAILLMHAIVLIFGFLLNAMQTIVEVGARLAGAGGDENGATRGGLVKVFGMRQLSRRLPRRDGNSRQSQLSSAAMLANDEDRKSYIMNDGRLRSQSAGSAGILLNRQSMGLDSNSIEPFGQIPPHALVGSGSSAYTPTTPGEASTFSFIPSAAAPSQGRARGQILGLTAAEAADPYYRPPRFRRPTLEASYSPGAKSRGSWTSGEWTNKRNSQPEGAASPEQAEEGPSISGRNTPTSPPAFAPALDGSPNEPRRSKADYTTREVDFYYGVRGPALNANIPSRRIKTGPADPTGPAASAAGWFKGLFGGKTKEKGKGFEVVRSSRMPPGMVARNAPGIETPPEGVPVATGGIRNGPIDSDDDEPVTAGPSTAGPTRPAAPTSHEDDALVSPIGTDDEEGSEESDDEYEITRISDVPPTLPGLEIPEGGIELPSRFPSKATSKASSRRERTTDTSFVPNLPTVPNFPQRVPSNKPTVPRKSSRRKSQSVDMTQQGAQFLHEHRAKGSLDTNFPFDRTGSRKRHSDISTRSSMGPNELADMGHSRGQSGGSALGKLSADFQDDRPTSVGYVHHHPIRTVNPSDNPEFLGSSAEVVDGRNSGASSIERPRT